MSEPHPFIGERATLLWFQNSRCLGNVGAYDYGGVYKIGSASWLIDGQENARGFLKHFGEGMLDNRISLADTHN